MNPSKENFVKKCITITTLSKSDLIKSVLSDRFSDMTDVSMGDIPSGIEILTHIPCHSSYPEYAFSLCSIPDDIENMRSHLIAYELDRYTESKTGPVTRGSSKRRRGGSRTRSSTQLENSFKESKELVPIIDIKLPILSIFKKVVNGENIILGNMPDILDEFFPGVKCVYAGIYSSIDKNTFVLLAVDNGRYRTSWKSNGPQNILKWYTSHEDVDRSVMKQITNESTNVHIVRKRNGEIRYMGKCSRIDDVDHPEGSCTMFVS